MWGLCPVPMACSTPLSILQTGLGSPSSFAPRLGPLCFTSAQSAPSSAPLRAVPAGSGEGWAGPAHAVLVPLSTSLCTHSSLCCLRPKPSS